MANLKIRVYQSSKLDPETTVTIPCGVLEIASKLIPTHVASLLQEREVDLDEIIRVSQNPDAYGTLLEVEDHTKNKRIVIDLE